MVYYIIYSNIYNKMSNDYKTKYLKYKIKYINLKETNLYGGNDQLTPQEKIDILTHVFMLILSGYTQMSNSKLKIDFIDQYNYYQPLYPTDLPIPISNSTTSEPKDNAKLMARGICGLINKSTKEKYDAAINTATGYNKKFKSTPLEQIIIDVLTLAKAK